MFYVLIFGILAVVLVVAVAAQYFRRDRPMREQGARTAVPKETRHAEQQRRAQSRRARRKRH